MIALDDAVRTWVVAHRAAPLDNFFWLLSVVGRGGMIWLAIAAVVAARRRRLHAFTVVLLGVLMASALADNVLKPAVHRTRPFVNLSGEVIGGRPNDSSFPSGHSANAFAGAFVLSALAARGAAAWWTLAAAIAFSRVYLGVHYPLDVIGGALVGLLCGWLATRLTRFPDL